MSEEKIKKRNLPTIESNKSNKLIDQAKRENSDTENIKCLPNALNSKKKKELIKQRLNIFSLIKEVINFKKKSYKNYNKVKRVQGKN